MEFFVIFLVYSSSVGVNGLANCPQLANASSFALLAASTITNTGLSYVYGNLGISPGTAVTGFDNITTGHLYGTEELATGNSLAAQGSLTTAYNTAAGASVTEVLSGSDLAGMTLNPGCYEFTSTAALTAGILTLNGSGIFIFQIGSSFLATANSQVILTNGATCSCVFWQIGTQATLATNVQFCGIIMAGTSVVFNTGATLYGSAMASTAAVNLMANSVYVQPACPACL